MRNVFALSRFFLLMLFFDLEFYVPPEERRAEHYPLSLPERPESADILMERIDSHVIIKPSFIFNPCRTTHKIIGGHFIRVEASEGEKGLMLRTLENKGLWIWNFDNERELIAEIYNVFLREWAWLYSGPRRKISDKTLREPMVVGFAVSHVDLPALHIRASHFSIAPPEELFTILLKTRVIDLSNAGSFLFPEDPYLYPKTANEVAERLGAKGGAPKKGSTNGKSAGKNVWKAYDLGNFDYIQERCAGEVEEMLRIYRELAALIQK